MCLSYIKETPRDSADPALHPVCGGTPNFQNNKTLLSAKLTASPVEESFTFDGNKLAPPATALPINNVRRRSKQSEKSFKKTVHSAAARAKRPAGNMLSPYQASPKRQNSLNPSAVLSKSKTERYETQQPVKRQPTSDQPFRGFDTSQ